MGMVVSVTWLNKLTEMQIIPSWQVPQDGLDTMRMIILTNII